MYKSRHYFEQGATALIIVIFSILLLTTVTVGFMRLVVNDQARSTNDELSRGAYDSAMAGVEDGKRVLEACRLDSSSDACKAISDQKCTTISEAGLVTPSADGDVLLKTENGADGGYDQAYTCVIVSPDTQDYKGSLENDSSRIIPLDTTGATGSSFNSLTILWFKRGTLLNGTSATARPASSESFPTVAGWLPASNPPTVVPPVIRAELMTYKKGGFDASNFDQSAAKGANAGTNTLFLYPSTNGVTSSTFLKDGRTRMGATSLIVRSQCDDSDATYFCHTTLTLPQSLTPVSDLTGYTASLRLTSIYGGTDFAVKLPTGTEFAGVQPIIDSTGRAADIFRRVEARVERVNPNENDLYPRSTVDLTNNFCKAFSVPLTDNYSYVNIYRSTDCAY
ncbi:MAG: hypothetical protein ABI397_01930 [Candidatus Saccharimonas sp.]